MINPANNTFIFEALGAQLERLTPDPLEIVVCGGAALQALGLVARATRDVDVLAVVRADPAGPILLTADPLPAALAEAAARVGRDLGLPAGWLNAGPTGLLTEGLPEAFVGRLHRRVFGERLVVQFTGRFDQICFKLYAALNGGGPRHLADLEALGPTPAEVAGAARWILTQDAGPQFPDLVRFFLRETGYSDVADSL
ncbi:MAG: hypothetical protein JO250_14290 [Armatimonadetes bacterium]|nr:hypothetical protein [Armatimonadota bacterium]